MCKTTKILFMIKEKIFSRKVLLMTYIDVGISRQRSKAAMTNIRENEITKQNQMEILELKLKYQLPKRKKYRISLTEIEDRKGRRQRMLKEMEFIQAEDRKKKMCLRNLKLALVSYGIISSYLTYVLEEKKNRKWGRENI